MYKRHPFRSGGKWYYRALREDGTEKTFTSNKAGEPGRRAVLSKGHNWELGITHQTKRTVGDYWPSFLKYYSDFHGKTEAYTEIVSVGKNYIIPLIGNKKVYELRYKLLQEFINNVRLKDGSRPSKKTLEKVRTTINQFVRYLSQVEEVCDPLGAALLIPRTAKPTPDTEILQMDDIRKLFNECDGHFVLGYRLQLLCGLRVGELLGLKKTDFDPESGRIVIRRSIDKTGRITPGKNNNARRTFLLKSLSLEIVQQQLEKIKEYETDWMFPSPIGGQPTQYQYYTEYKSLGLPASPRVLRHTFVSLIKYDVPLEIIKAEIGHSKVMTTLETYGRPLDGIDDEKNAALIDSALMNKLDGIINIGNNTD
jgi:integrase